MSHLLRRWLDAFSGRKAGTPVPCYQRRPGVRTLGELVLPSEDSEGALVLNEVGLFIWNQLEAPMTVKALVAAVTGAYSVDARSAESDVLLFLDQLSTDGLVAVIGESTPQEPARPRATISAACLSAAWDRAKARDWEGALRSCLAAAHETECPEIVELDILICRYHLGAGEDISGQALALAPRLPMLARIACWGLAMASAFRAGDLRMTKIVACELARQIHSPWDLPTVPDFVNCDGGTIVVMEPRAVEPMLAMIAAVRTRSVNSSEEAGLLGALAQRYRERASS